MTIDEWRTGWRMAVVAMVCLLAGVWFAPAMAQEPAPPAQPADGPGGSGYAHAAVATERVGDLPTGEWVFVPEGVADAVRAEMPVVLLLHGFGATDPQTYRGWITHLVRSGNVVVYPDYQPEGFLVFDQAAFVENMVAGTERAFDQAGLDPDAIHVVGHSLGAVIGVAAIGEGPDGGLPPVASLTLVAPGGCSTCGSTSGFGIPLPETLEVPAGMLVHAVTGSDDAIVGDGDARAIWSRLEDIPAGQKRFVDVRSDGHGEPVLVADHLFVQSDGFGSGVDALDWFGAWRPLDALIACAETGELCEVALGTDAEALFMGEWSDGTPVAPMVVVDR
jgi:pimeloyl-ACP methyl ester carboxylesterase